MDIRISPSLLSADLADLKNEIKRAEYAGADRLHFDVMDGVFVDNISYGIPVLKCVRKCTSLPLDVHLMIIDPIKYIEQFISAGASSVTFHAESKSDIGKTIDKIHAFGAEAGLTVRPNTPCDDIIKFLPKIQTALVMSVEPGFGGQGFIHETMGKVTAIRKIIEENKYGCYVQVDGGINAETAKIAISAGADDLVSGSYLFASEDMKTAIAGLRSVN